MPLPRPWIPGRSFCDLCVLCIPIKPLSRSTDRPDRPQMALERDGETTDRDTHWRGEDRGGGVRGANVGW